MQLVLLVKLVKLVLLVQVASTLRNVVHANIAQPDKHGFVIVGNQTLYLVHVPMFYMEAHRFQCILKADFRPKEVDLIRATRAAHPDVSVPSKPLSLASLTPKVAAR